MGAGHHRQTGLRQQLQGFVFARCARRQGRVGWQFCCGSRSRAPRILGHESQRAESAHRAAGLLQYRNAGCFELLSLLGPDQAIDAKRNRRMARMHGDQGIDIELCPRRAQQTGGRKEQGHVVTTVVSATPEHALQRVFQQLGMILELAGDVDRVARTGEGNHGSNIGLRRCRHFGHVKPDIGRLVRHQNANPARSRQQADAVRCGAGAN